MADAARMRVQCVAMDQQRRQDHLHLHLRLPYRGLFIPRRQGVPDRAWQCRC